MATILEPNRQQKVLQALISQGVSPWTGTIESWANTAKFTAWSMPVYDGQMARTGYVVQACRWFIVEHSALVALTRDGGMHAGGWWKNPDYDKCIHLSLSFRDVETGEPMAKQGRPTDAIVRAVFGDRRRYLWCEPPYSDNGKKLDVWHYRLFVQPDWRTPILPRGEVYTRDFIPKDWKSWSDQQADRAVPNQGGPIS